MKRASSQFSKGSVLVYTLILLFLVLTASINMMTSSVTGLRSVGTSDRSMQAFQIANSGSEAVINMIKNASGTIQNISPSMICPAAIFEQNSYLGGSYRTIFRDIDGNSLSCSDGLSQITSIKTVGVYRETARAIEMSVTVPARLIGHWKLNGDADDSSGNGYNGTPSGFVPPFGFVNAPPNQALEFSGTGINEVMMVDIAHEPNFDLKRTISISLWFKVNSSPLSGWAPLVSKMNDSGDEDSRAYSIWLAPDGFVHLTSSSVSGTQSCVDTDEDVNEINSGTWYHYVGVIDRNEGYMTSYIDGAVAPLKDHGGGCSLGSFSGGTDAKENDDPVRIGGYFGGAPYSEFGGQIDDVRIYDGILTSTEVATLHTDGRE